MKIILLTGNAYATDGTTVATVTLANALADLCVVEIVSSFRNRDFPIRDIDSRVTLRSLVDVRPGQSDLDHPYYQEKSQFAHVLTQKGVNRSRLMDERGAQFLQQCDADVLIASTPICIALLGNLGTDRYIKIAHGHTTYHHQSAGTRRILDAAIPKLDGLVTVSAKDAQTHKDAYGIIETAFHAIPNVTEDTRLRADVEGSRILIMAGRFVPVKQIDVAIKAFAQVAERRAEWTLRIYGGGQLQAEMQNLISSLGLSDRVLLMGSVKHLREEIAKSALMLSTSRDEAYPLTFIEAMTCGVPVLSTAGVHGPSEIIEDGKDGILSPVGDVDAYAGSLDRLIRDVSLRARLGRGARAKGVVHTDHALFLERHMSFIELLQRAKSFRPAADCTVINGTLDLQISPGLISTTDSFTVWCISATNPHQTVYCGLADHINHGDLHAIVPSGLRIPAGSWDIALRREGDHTVRKIKARSIQQGTNSLISSPSETPVRFRTASRHESEGQLQVVSRELRAHAEVARTLVDKEGISVWFTLMGVPCGEEPRSPSLCVLIRSRSNAQRQVRVKCLPSAHGFTFRISLAEVLRAMLGNGGIWDVSITHEHATESQEEIRLGKLGDDIMCRKAIEVHPAVSMLDSSGKKISLRPYYTDSNFFSLRMSQS